MIRVSYGTWYDDLRDGLPHLAHSGLPVHECRLSTCWCGSNAFWIEFDAAIGVAQRVCACGIEVPLVNSTKVWPLAQPTLWRCSCGNDTANVGAGFCLPPPGHAIEHVYIGARCADCGVVELVSDWRLGYEPSRYLMDQI